MVLPPGVAGPDFAECNTIDSLGMHNRFGPLPLCCRFRPVPGITEMWRNSGYFTAESPCAL